jgi:hypothetical protein
MYIYLYIHTYIHTHLHTNIQRVFGGMHIFRMRFITGQNEREESTQNTTVTRSAACASYKIKATT